MGKVGWVNNIMYKLFKKISHKFKEIFLVLTNWFPHYFSEKVGNTFFPHHPSENLSFRMTKYLCILELSRFLIFFSGCDSWFDSGAQIIEIHEF